MKSLTPAEESRARQGGAQAPKCGENDYGSRCRGSREAEQEGRRERKVEEEQEKQHYGGENDERQRVSNSQLQVL